MMGDIAPPPPVQADDPAEAKRSVTDNISTTPSSRTKQADASLSADADSNTKNAASSTASPLLPLHSASVTLSGKAEHDEAQQQQTLTTSEEAFERALYAAYFKAPRDKELAMTTAAGDPAEVAESAESGTAATSSLMQEERSSGVDTSDAVAATEAAFERALYGFVESDDTTTAGAERLRNKGEVEEVSTVSPTSDTSASTTSSKKEVDEPHDEAATQDDALVDALEAATATDPVPMQQDSGGHGDDALLMEQDAALEDDDSLFESDEFFTAPRTERSAEANETSTSDACDKGETADAKKPRPAPRAETEPQPLHPPPPPTVSMRCPFTLTNIDMPDDAHALSDAVFGVADFHTTAVTHLDPADRVEACMPLLDRASKLSLFYESGWLMQLQAQENAWISNEAVTVKRGTLPEETSSGNAEALEGTSASAIASEAAVVPPFSHREVLGRSKVLRCLVFRLLRAPHLWWDQVQEVVSRAAQAAEQQNLGGRRCQLSLVVDKAREESDVTASTQGTLSNIDASASSEAPHSLLFSTQEIRSAMTRIFGTHPLHVHFVSAAMQQEITKMLRDVSAAPQSSTSSPLPLPSLLTGPVAAWRAFILTHRLSVSSACGPHVKPFSYGEFRPTITAAELAPLRYCEERTSWPPSLPQSTSTAVSLAQPALPPSSSSSNQDSAHNSNATGSSSGTAATTHPWAAMNEQEQNAFLFGDQSAQLSAQIRSSDGIFLVYGQNGLSFEEEDKLTAAEEALRQSEQEANEAGEEGGAKLSPLEQAQAEEMTRVRLYDVDGVVLELTVAEARRNTASGSSSSFLHEVASAAASASQPKRGRGVRAASSSKASTPFHLQLQSKEDVQLAALWQRFVSARTADLVDNLVHVQQHAGGLLRDAAAEMVVQTAFWLLFYARDEVRAVTDPRRTYETVWALHDRLMDLLAAPLLSGDADGARSEGMRERAVAGGEAARPAFERLALTSQVSYACFGVAHVPPLRIDDCGAASSGDVSEAPLEPTATSPAELYGALAAHRTSSTAAASVAGASSSPVQEGEFDIDAALPPSVAAIADFATLSSLQQLAVGFCFPHTPAEEAEVALRQRGQATSAPKTTAAAAESVSDGDSVRGSPTEASDTYSGTPLALRTQSRRRGARIAAWVSHAEAHLAAEETAAGAAAAALQRAVDSSARRRGRPPAVPEIEEASGSPVEDTTSKDAAGGQQDEEESCEALQEAEAGEFVPNEPTVSSAVVRVDVLALEAQRARETAQAHAREALSASVHRCFASLRAAGVLPTSLSESNVKDDEGGIDHNPLFTPTQEAVVQHAVDTMVTSFYRTAEDRGEEDTLSVVDAGSAASAEDAEQQEQVPAAPTPPRRRGRSVKTAKPAMESEGSPDVADVASAVGTKTTQEHFTTPRAAAPSNAQQPLKRGRVRPRRVPDADGTYTKAAYRHSAAYLERQALKVKSRQRGGTEDIC